MKTDSFFKKILLILIVFFSIHGLKSQQMVYKPINPALGGESFNYSWLLSSANAQNQFDSSQNYGYKSPSAIGSFQDNLNRQLLNKISNSLFGGDFGNTTLAPGVYNTGSLTVTISEYFGGLNISIIDTNTGEQTNINLPHNK